MQKNLVLNFYQLNFSKIFFINLFLILGIVFQKFNYYFLISFICFSIFSLLTHYYFIKNIEQFSFYPIAFLAGAFLFQKQQNDFYFFKKNFTYKDIDIIGKIVDINKSNKITIIFNIQKIKIDEYWKDNNYLIKIYLNKNEKIGDLEIDDLIKIENISLYFGNNYMSENLKKEGIYSYSKPNEFKYKIVKKNNFSLNRFIQNLRHKTFKNIRSKLDKKVFALFSSIFLGNKNEETKTISIFKKDFNNWGLAHYLARSGLHLVIIFFSWFLLISLLPISYNKKQLIIFFIISFYSFLSWNSIPFIRSIITFAIYKFCILLDLQIDTLHCLNFACIAMLLYNPSQIFYLDFQLSFALTFALIWINSLNKNQV